MITLIQLTNRISIRPFLARQDIKLKSLRKKYLLHANFVALCQYTIVIFIACLIIYKANITTEVSMPGIKTM